MPTSEFNVQPVLRSQLCDFRLRHPLEFLAAQARSNQEISPAATRLICPAVI
ncbi:hypothetical protein H6F67_02150 [Microcoleus sp. FACHB-1515]|uniref:hypothetical protein n=1 Tax=Cyanophyceae TaxID=3028117 RepID=UPI001689B2D2|nr:hypothetical protein [Microcoleus sp. FACHB-1515]MBD2088662.1 hypothetical protein [Microcoleus sp. FACHB-1515]